MGAKGATRSFFEMKIKGECPDKPIIKEKGESSMKGFGILRKEGTENSNQDW